MREAKVTNLMGAVVVSDLNLRLERGQSVFVPEKLALKSEDLVALEKLGAVRVTYYAHRDSVKKKSDMPEDISLKLDKIQMLLEEVLQKINCKG